MDYSPFNPVIWLIMAGFVAITYLAVKVFHGKYPDYPYDVSEQRVDDRGKEAGK
jgi:hypothetical protein